MCTKHASVNYDVAVPIPLKSADRFCLALTHGPDSWQGRYVCDFALTHGLHDRVSTWRLGVDPLLVEFKIMIRGASKFGEHHLIKPVFRGGLPILVGTLWNIPTSMPTRFPKTKIACCERAIYAYQASESMY